ncbi:peptidase inhibitor family I36 protein [Micromonospora sediminimaris]|uniref:Peptidase inhibitor family I36 n=1 Tax=Micromonospora sediminimaris TaxID=547162 RepID=A0A9W5UU08_9ACTN|nr:peptidase inhibitor family I36 protein [Micromonospora sediminimaris]GIJ33240.1 hypothetical protein Vse01_23880 [Micromonospora sediminimaris]SFC07614.1 hypothetical protein SAMN05216284_102420 [Micromonospora sediminimaris]
MPTIIRFRALLTVIVAVLLAGVTVPAPALAAPAPRTAMRTEVARYLAAHPGGTVLNDNEISYRGGELIVTLDAPVGTYGVADCPSGWFCFYEWPNYGYPRGKLSSCGWQNLSTWSWQFRVESAHYNLGSGHVGFYYHNQELFRINPSKRLHSDAGQWRNWANRVYRHCP